MKLTQIFQKPVDRNIEGVIKADDETSLRLEIEEYVLTNEVSKRLEAFLEAYNDYQGANGAWISGFFGSGKSHLLKILALLLENRAIDGTPAFDLFAPKCKDNGILRGGLQKAVSIPSKSILFNIDQKADVISKAQFDALLAVFVKVFDETCGYYGKQGYIAAFERDLDRRGLYGAFQQSYAGIAGIPWESGREQALLEADNIARAYGAAVPGAATNTGDGILDRYRADYKVSIEDFATQVNDYIELQGKNFRLNFFVDEVGQYIANNTKLMTNLQTIAESLTTKCHGRAWIIVTAQEDINSVIGEMNAQQANDFSKIQARFATRMKLTSQNVDEVIQKRLLAKTDAGAKLLTGIYGEQANNFGTLFDFSDGSQMYRNFRDERHFIDSYPFIPYQFTLFQATIQSLSLHNAFEGRHSSVGERSMLAVFQEVAIRIADSETGQLATFDLLFEGIRSALKSQIQRSILTAESHLRSPFAVRVLKALFLVKYVKEFKATIHNVCVLMTDRFDCDLPQLRKDVEEALNLLEQQTYIQRNGDLYEYLTNEEKDVEEEIKNTSVDTDAVAEELARIVFDQIIRDKKIRFDDNNQDFAFTRRLDDHLLGREYETSIHVVSPFHPFIDDEETLRMHSMGRAELMILLPADNRLIQDLLMYKRTEKYVRQNTSQSKQESIQNILRGKSSQNSERLKQIETRVKDLVSCAKLFIGGEAIEVTSTEPLTRILRGFQELIKRTYPNLKMLRSKAYQESEIETCLHPAGGSLLNGETAVLGEAEQEILAFIQANSRAGVRTTLKTVVDRFESKPYGWSLAAILCQVALLSAHGKMELRADGNLLEDAALARTLRNTQAHANTVLEPQIEFTSGQVRKLKEFYEDFFDTPAQSSEARDLGKETAAALEERHRKLKELLGNQSRYPILSGLAHAINLLQTLIGKPYTFYLTDLGNVRESLLDEKEKVIGPVLSFWEGPQRAAYDDARQFYTAQHANFEYLDGPEAGQLRDLLGSPNLYEGNRMQQVRGLVETLKSRVAVQLRTEKEHGVERLTAQRERLTAMEEFGRLTPDQQTQLTRTFENARTKMEAQTLIAVVRDGLRSFEEREYPLLLSRMTEWARPQPVAPEGPAKDGGGPDGITPRKEPQIQYVPSSAIKVHFDKAWLADDGDVDVYLNALREALLSEIYKGKRIQI